jgi:hypothetical protein
VVQIPNDSKKYRFENVKAEKPHYILVLLPGFQKGRDIRASQGKGQGAVLA